MVGADRSRRRWLVALVASVVVGVVVVAGALFQPWKAFTDVVVREGDPFAGAVSTTTAPMSTSPGSTSLEPEAPSQPVVLATGSFTSIAHPTTGTARLGTVAGGSPVLFLEGLDTDNGPDLKVYLSRAPAGGDAKAFGVDPLSLGDLKGNRGDQVYTVPAGADVSSFRSVVIWCERFAVGFGVAPLDPP